MPTPTSLQKLARKLKRLSAELLELDDDTVTEIIIDNRIRMYET
jgi:hypothetical protein